MIVQAMSKKSLKVIVVRRGDGGDVVLMLLKTKDKMDDERKRRGEELFGTKMYYKLAPETGAPGLLEQEH